jgi:long-chain acyl-CoA synthetase
MALTAEEIDAAVEGRTVASDFFDMADRLGDATAVRWEEGDDWKSMTVSELGELALRAAAGLKKIGVGKGDRVVMMMRNIPEFHWCDLAILCVGATPISIYNSSAPEQIEYMVNHCGAKLAILENSDFLSRFSTARPKLETIKDIVVLDRPDDAPADVLDRSDLLEQGSLTREEAVGASSPEDIATIIYTSGTTGMPKGVMISNRNVVWTSESALDSYGLSREDVAGMRVVSYLPMAHIAERMVSHYLLLGAGAEVTACPETSLLTTYLGHVHPNIAFGVPRVWEKVHAGVMAALSADPERAEKFNEAVEAGEPIREKMTWGTATDEEIATYQFLDDVAFSQVRALLGLDELAMAVTGASPIPASLVTWFRTIGIPLAEVYGMSENTGPMTFERFKVKPGLCGTPLPGTEVKIFPDGEVCCRGGHVFAGYLNDPEKTAEAIDDDGWLHTGDIGEFDDDGYLKIVDRKKELIITAGGKNLSPANLEAALKTVPLIGQAAAIGDNRPFVSALVVIDGEVAPGWAAKHGVEFTTLEEFAELPQVVDAVNEGVEESMSGFNSAERVKKVKILTEEWLPDSELLTPTSKLKRRGVNERFAKEIEEIYA